MASLSNQESISGPLRCYPIRIHPNQEVVSSLLDLVRSNNLTSAFIMTCVGSVKKAHLRMADEQITKHLEGPHEIVSLVGTVSGCKRPHLHISLSDREGNVIGGHVLGDLIVYTTAEIIVGHIPGVMFAREDDPETGYGELDVQKC